MKKIIVLTCAMALMFYAETVGALSIVTEPIVPESPKVEVDCYDNYLGKFIPCTVVPTLPNVPITITPTGKPETITAPITITPTGKPETITAPITITPTGKPETITVPISVMPISSEKETSPKSVTQPVSVEITQDQTIKIKSEKTISITTEPVMVKENSIFIKTGEEFVPVNVLPHQVPKIVAESNATLIIQQIELKTEEKKPIYEITTQRDAKLLWIIPMIVEGLISIDASTGELISASKPWWSFLAR